MNRWDSRNGMSDHYSYEASIAEERGLQRIGKEWTDRSYESELHDTEMYDMEQEDEYEESQQKYLHGMVGFIGYVVTLIVYIVLHCSLTMQGQVLLLLGWIVIDFVVYLIYTVFRRNAPIQHKNWGIRLIHMNRCRHIVHSL